MPNMAKKEAHITFSDGPYKNRVYRQVDPNQEPPEGVHVTDGGNTLETPNHKIFAHYIGMHDPEIDGPLPNPEDLPPC